MTTQGQKVGYFLLLALAALSPWGDLMRWGSTTSEGSERGVTTLLAFALIALCWSFRKVPQILLDSPRPLFFVCFLLIGAATSLEATKANSGVSVAIQLGGYFMLAFAIASLRLGKNEILQVLMVFTISAALMSVTSFIDYLGIIDIPRINERYVSVELEDDTRVSNLLGPFWSQTAMSTHLSLALPIPLCFLLSESSLKTAAQHHFISPKRYKILWAVCFAIIGAASLLTFSRNLIVSFIAVVGYLAYTGIGRRWVKQGVVIGAFLCGGFYFLQNFAPEQHTAFSLKFSSLQPHKVVNNYSDMIRRDTLLETWRELGESPLGVGFTRPVLSGIGEINVHSNFTYVLRAGGIIGIILVCLFFWPIIRRAIKMRDRQIESPLFAALLSFAIYGITHTTINTLFFWVLLGIAFPVAGVGVPRVARSSSRIAARTRELLKA